MFESFYLSVETNISSCWIDFISVILLLKSKLVNLEQGGVHDHIVPT